MFLRFSEEKNHWAFSWRNTFNPVLIPGMKLAAELNKVSLVSLDLNLTESWESGLGNLTSLINPNCQGVCSYGLADCQNWAPEVYTKVILLTFDCVKGWFLFLPKDFYRKDIWHSARLCLGTSQADPWKWKWWSCAEKSLLQTMGHHAKNSMKYLKQPTSMISHWFPVEKVHNGPKLCKCKLFSFCCQNFSDVFRVCHMKADVRPILKMWCFFCYLLNQSFCCSKSGQIAKNIARRRQKINTRLILIFCRHIESAWAQ